MRPLSSRFNPRSRAQRPLKQKSALRTVQAIKQVENPSLEKMYGIV